MPPRSTDPVSIYTSVCIPASLLYLPDAAMDLSSYTSKSAFVRDVLLFFCGSLRRGAVPLSETAAKEAAHRLYMSLGVAFADAFLDRPATETAEVATAAGASDSVEADMVRRICEGDVGVSPQEVRQVWRLLPLDVRLRIMVGQSASEEASAEEGGRNE